MELVREHALFSGLQNAGTIAAKQAVLDAMTPDVMQQLQPCDICHHMAAVYTKTVADYVRSPHQRDIIDELVPFMEMLSNGALVLDVGCGSGRDTFFMSVADRKFRFDLMGRKRHGKTTREKYAVPEKVFDVIGIDASEGMLEQAKDKCHELEAGGLLDHCKSSPFFLYSDMHAFTDELLYDFDGVWSCTALFTHTLYGLLEKAMRSVKEALNSKGVFFVSYINGRGDKYDHLRISTTGEVKYFSQPDPDEITELAGKFGLVLVQEEFNDHEVDGKVVRKDLFVSQFFRKE